MWLRCGRRRKRQALVGPLAFGAIAGLRARIFFLDAAAVDPQGAYGYSAPEAEVLCRLADIADQVVLLAGHTAKTGSAPALVSRLAHLTGAMLSGPPPVALAAALGDTQVPVHVVSA